MKKTHKERRKDMSPDETKSAGIVNTVLFFLHGLYHFSHIQIEESHEIFNLGKRTL